MRGHRIAVAGSLVSPDGLTVLKTLCGLNLFKPHVMMFRFLRRRRTRNSIVAADARTTANSMFAQRVRVAQCG